jgi:hypothetical protein
LQTSTPATEPDEIPTTLEDDFPSTNQPVTEQEQETQALPLGPRQNIAMKHVQRIERMFEPFGIYSETRIGITELNDVFIQTIPSKNIGAMRGYDRVPLIFLDEADFYLIGQQQEARAVAEGYIPKTHPNLDSICLIPIELTSGTTGCYYDGLICFTS